MRRFVPAAAALMVLTGPAVSAELEEPIYSPPSAWSWTGCYAGGHVGGLWSKSEEWVVRTQGGAFEGQSLGDHDADDFVGGIQGGCDYQFTGGFVVGIRGDYGWTQARGTHASAREFGVFYHSEIEALASVTGRIGYGWERLLGYIEAGAAWEDVDYSASTIIVGTAYRASDSRSGWTIGAGGEYAITEQVSVFIEYGYYDFGTERVRFTPQLPGLPPAFLDIDETANVVRAGINLRFGR